MSIVYVTTLFSGRERRYISEETEDSRKMLSKYQWKSEESGILKVSGHREATVVANWTLSGKFISGMIPV